MKTLDDALREAAESLHDEAAKLPDRSWTATRPTDVKSGLLVAAAIAIAVFVVIGVPNMLFTDGTEADMANPAVPQIDSPDPATVGVPVSDEEFTDAMGGEEALVPGSARLIAESEIPGMGVYKVFTVELGYVDRGRPFDSPVRCIIGPSGGICPGDVTDFAVSAGAACSPSPVMTVTVQGLESDMTAIFHLTDGTSAEVEPENGVALWAWDAAHGIADITVTNPTDKIENELARLDGYWLPELPYFSCTD